MTFPATYAGRQGNIAYVEFGDEDAMKAALEKHDEVSCSLPTSPPPVITSFHLAIDIMTR